MLFPPTSSLFRFCPPACLASVPQPVYVMSSSLLPIYLQSPSLHPIYLLSTSLQPIYVLSTSLQPIYVFSSSFQPPVTAYVLFQLPGPEGRKADRQSCLRSTVQYYCVLCSEVQCCCVLCSVVQCSAGNMQFAIQIAVKCSKEWSEVEVQCKVQYLCAAHLLLGFPKG